MTLEEYVEERRKRVANMTLAQARDLIAKTLSHSDMEIEFDKAVWMLLNCADEKINGGWIPVTERLPEPNRLVLCYITTGATETYFLALWNDTLNAWEEGIGGYRLLENDLGYEVIAWMQLPEPYRTGREK